MALKLIDSGIFPLLNDETKAQIPLSNTARTLRKIKYVVRQTIGIPLSSIGVTHSNATTLANAPKMFDGEGDILEAVGTDGQVDIRSLFFFTDADDMEVHYWAWDD